MVVDEMTKFILKFLGIIVSTLFLTSCGRHHHGYIINESEDTLNVEFHIQTSKNPHQENYFYEDIISQSKSSEDEFKLPGDLLVKVDTANKIAILKFLPGDIMSLGTLRIDESRDDYKSWEFSKIKIWNNHNDLITAENKGIMRLIEKRTSFFSQDSHYLILGFK